MSERGDGNEPQQSSSAGSIALMLALIVMGWVIMAFVVNHSQANAIRDLQRRVGQLEQQLK